MSGLREANRNFKPKKAVSMAKISFLHIDKDNYWTNMLFLQNKSNKFDLWQIIYASSKNYTFIFIFSPKYALSAPY